MDGVSSAASFASLLELAYKLTLYTKDVFKAKEERQKLIDGLDRLRSTIERLDDRFRDAKPGDPWSEGILELIRTSGRFTLEGEYEPNPKNKSETPLSRVYIILATLNLELAPSHGVKKYGQRLRYHWDKVKYEGLLREFARCQQDISSVLDEDHFKISKAIREDGKETLVQVNDIGNRLRVIEDRTRRQEEERVKQKEEALEEAVERWLSPRDFLSRQEELLEQAFGTGQWFLDSLVFQHWVKGKPWHLRCYGVEGAGKVCQFSRKHAPRKFCF
jgi:hypothetical protein